MKMICGQPFPECPVAPGWDKLSLSDVDQLKAAAEEYRRQYDEYSKAYREYLVQADKFIIKLVNELESQGIPRFVSISLRGLQLKRNVEMWTYLRAALVEPQHWTQQSRFDDRIREVERKVNDRKAEADRRQAELLKSGFLENAVAFLQEQGKILGKDFTLENAYECARELAREVAVKEKLSVPRPIFYSFDGDYNCEVCEGWDGESHRCSCGNRRVGWVESSFDGRKMELYAEAY